MSRQEALALLETALNEAPGTITESTSLDALSGWDSVGMVSLMALVDSSTGVVLPPEELRSSATAGELIRLFSLGA